MNTTTSDYGKTTLSIGAPGSLERCRIEYPKLINHISYLLEYSRTESRSTLLDIAQLIIDTPIKSQIEIENILELSRRKTLVIPQIEPFEIQQIIKIINTAKGVLNND